MNEIATRSFSLFLVLCIAAVWSRAHGQVPEVGGLIVLEAENCNANIAHTAADGVTRSWVSNSVFPGSSGAGYMQALPNTNGNVTSASAPAQSPQLQFKVSFAANATRHAWVRMESDSTSDNSCWIGINASSPGIANSTALATTANGAWQWRTSAGIPNAAGNFILSIYMGEDGLRVDRLLVTTNSTFQTSLGNAWHNPPSPEVPGGTTMRNPVNVDAGTDVTVYSGSTGNAVPGGSLIYYKRATDAAWSSLPMTFISATGSSNYFSGTIPSSGYSTGDTVEYYIRAWFTDRLPSFVCYPNGTSTVVELESDAQAAPFAFTIGPLGPAPAATTLAGTDVTPASATLRGSANPKGMVSSAWFEYGPTISYGSVSSRTNLLLGTNDLPVAAGISGLVGGTTNHYRLLVSNAVGTAFGADNWFIVPIASVATLEPTSGSTTGMTLRGQANPNGTAASGWFEWGETASYGNTTPPQSLGNGASGIPMNFVQALSGLDTGITYHYRAIAAAGSTTNYGADQLFTPLFSDSGFAFPGFAEGWCGWGDYDNDGRLDVWLSGTTSSGGTNQIWHNNGSGFSNINLTMQFSAHRGGALGDFDNDGLLDVLWSADLWRNTGAGFSSNADFASAIAGTVAWSDYDHDGLLDVALAGNDTNPGGSIWRNTGNGFSNLNLALPQCYSGRIAWGDYDNDGRPDLLITGLADSSSPGIPTTQIWRNTGAGFTNISAGLPGVAWGTGVWIDYDGDGLLDVFLTGLSVTNFGNLTGSPLGFTNYLTQLWRNNGSGFVLVTNFPGMVLSSAAWGDYDNDGRPDLLLTGRTATDNASTVAQLWHNTTNGFINIGAGLPQLAHGSVAWGDYDNDGRLDILICGLDETSSPVTKVLRNNIAQINTPPTPPANLSATVSNSVLVLSWTRGADVETPASALTYNLRVGTTPRGQEIVSPMADTNGNRRLPQVGNCGGRNFALLQYNPALNYHWSVQSIDTALAGSPFAPEHLVAPVLTVTISGPSSIQLAWSTNFPGYMLQSAAQLLSSGTDWTTVAGSPGISNGQFVQADSISMQRFYRLKK